MNPRNRLTRALASMAAAFLATVKQMLEAPATLLV